MRREAALDASRRSGQKTGLWPAISKVWGGFGMTASLLNLFWSGLCARVSNRGFDVALSLVRHPFSWLRCWMSSQDIFDATSSLVRSHVQH